MRLEIAGSKDNLELLDFYQQFPLRGLVELKVDRHQDFFAPYKAMSDQYRVYCLRDENDNNLQATASFIFRESLLDGKQVRVAYATDLRVANNRKAIVGWSQHFLPVMEQVMKDHDVSHIFSSINLTDPGALNAFVRPRTMKRPMPRYFLYRKFDLVTLHGRFPWAAKPLESLRIEKGSEKNLESLGLYISKRAQYRPFSTCWNKESLLKKIQRLPGLKLEDFLIAFNHQGEVVGCMAPWSPQNVQSLIPLSYSLLGHNFRQTLKFLWLLGMTRKLTKPVVSTGEESPLLFHYLTNLFVDNEDVFESLLWYAFEGIGSKNFLTYTHTDQDFRLKPPESWISAHLPHALYAVVPPVSETPAFLHPSISLNPEIELSFL